MLSFLIKRYIHIVTYKVTEYFFDGIDKLPTVIPAKWIGYVILIGIQRKKVLDGLMHNFYKKSFLTEAFYSSF